MLAFRGSTRRLRRYRATPAVSRSAALATIAVTAQHELALVLVGGFVVEALSVIIQVFWYKRNEAGVPWRRSTIISVDGLARIDRRHPVLIVSIVLALAGCNLEAR